MTDFQQGMVIGAFAVIAVWSIAVVVGAWRSSRELERMGRPAGVQPPKLWPR